jgi:hypothetical protein
MKNYFFKYLLCLGISILTTIPAHAWGAKGHRIIGEIAQRHLEQNVSKKVLKILKDESLAMSSTWMDFIKSDDSFDHMYPWHYCTIPDSSFSFQENLTLKEGDVVQTLQRLIKEFKSKKFKDGDERMAVRMLVHLIGDIHQPLHVGNGKDRGGNDFKVNWFNEESNLHKIWDSEIINYQDLSYTEYADWVDQDIFWVESLNDKSVIEWALESKKIRVNGLYPDTNILNLSYDYNFQHIETLNSQLLKAGFRLAMVLNEIYG